MKRPPVFLQSRGSCLSTIVLTISLILRCALRMRKLCTFRIGLDWVLQIPFSSPELTILSVCARDRDLWQGPKQEVRESRTSGFCAQLQKFETITVTIGYKNGQLLRLRVTWPLPEVSILGADQKGRGLWGRECTDTSNEKPRSDTVHVKIREKRD